MPELTNADRLAKLEAAACLLHEVMDSYPVATYRNGVLDAVECEIRRFMAQHLPCPSMTPEQIVGALAARARTREDGGTLTDEGVCWLCLADPCATACPHRLAVEWVAANPEKNTQPTREDGA